MNLNFREALVTLTRALPLVLFRAGIFVAGGFAIIILFGMLLVAFRLAGGSPILPLAAGLLVFSGWWISALVMRRFFLYRHRAGMLLLFSGRTLPSPGLATAIREAGRFFPDHSRWAAVNRNLRRFLAVQHRFGAELPVLADARAGAVDLLATGLLGQSILVLAFLRDGKDASQSAREGLALYLEHGLAARNSSRAWLGFSAVGLLLLFLCLALPNWFFFGMAGVPAWIGVALAAVIAWLLHQAFVVPFVLAGISSTLLAETRGYAPDPDLSEKLASMLAF